MSAPVQKENSNPELDQLCINTIRALSLDAVHETLIDVVVTAPAPTPVGAVGACVSAHGFVEALI